MYGLKTKIIYYIFENWKNEYCFCRYIYNFKIADYHSAKIILYSTYFYVTKEQSFRGFLRTNEHVKLYKNYYSEWWVV